MADGAHRVLDFHFHSPSTKSLKPRKHARPLRPHGTMTQSTSLFAHEKEPAVRGIKEPATSNRPSNVSKCFQRTFFRM